jgi:hypothetical protein
VIDLLKKKHLSLPLSATENWAPNPNLRRRQPESHEFELHHDKRLKDHERYDDDLEQLREGMVEHLKRIEKLERTVNTLSSMVNWDKVIVHEEGF